MRETFMQQPPIPDAENNQSMLQKAGKKAVIVLTPGRSGSSLLMQILQAFGLRLSEHLNTATGDNPDGDFEDAEMFALHNKYSELLGVQVYLPAQQNLAPPKEEAQFQRELSALLQKNVYEKEGLWGMKDPKISSFFPLWQAELKRHRIVPLFILALRSPSATLRSFLRYYPRTSSDMAELIWLSRVYDALYYSGGNCCIVHYEDWFTRPVETAHALLQFTGLDSTYSGDIADTLNNIIKPTLNRAVHEEYTVHNKRIEILYKYLKECRGTDWNHENPMRIVMDYRNDMQVFSFLNDRIVALSKKNSALTTENITIINKRDNDLAVIKDAHKNELEKNDAAWSGKYAAAAADKEKAVADKEKAVADVEKLVLANSSYVAEIKALQDTIKDLLIKAASLQAKVKDVVGATGKQQTATHSPGGASTLLRGSADHVRGLLAYRFGEILADPRFGLLSTPSALLGQYRAYRKEEKKRGTPLPVLTDFADADEGRTLCRTLPYMLGKAFISSIASPLGWCRLPFALRKIRREHHAAFSAKNT